MRLPTILTIALALLLIGFAASVGCSNPDNMSFVRLAVTGPQGDDGSHMQAPAPGGGAAPATPGGVTPPAGSKDATAKPGAAAPTDPKIADAMSGIRDYEVTYDKTKTREENTPQDLKSLGVTYAGDESPVAKRTKALRTLDLKRSLKDRYTVTEDKFAADPKKDYAPDKPEQTLNYYQPRPDPFSITDQIPKELRPKYEGVGLEGEVDPELLKQLHIAQYTADLRLVPLVIIGTMQNGPMKVCIYTIAGYGRTYTISEHGGPQYRYWNGLLFSVSAMQVSEDYVVLSLQGYTRYGDVTTPVIRTFHVNK